VRVRLLKIETFFFLSFFSCFQMDQFSSASSGLYHQQRTLTEPVNRCAGCDEPIVDQYLLKVIKKNILFDLKLNFNYFNFCFNSRPWIGTGTRIASSADAVGVVSVKWDRPCTQKPMKSFANAITSDCLALRAVAPPVPKSSRPLRWWWGLKQTFTTSNASPVSSATRGFA